MKPILLLLLMTFAGSAYGASQADSTWIRAFDKDNNIQVYTGYNNTQFTLTQAAKQHIPGMKLYANSAAYAGVCLNYKYLSLSYDWTLPNTRLSGKNKGIKVVNYQLAQVGRRLGIEAFYQRIDGLLMQIQRRKHKFDPVPNVTYTKAGANLLLFTNPAHYSYNAANYFSKWQQKTAGTGVVMLTPSYQQFHFHQDNTLPGKDSMLHKNFQEQPQWLTCIAYAGYTVNVISRDKHWSINPMLLAGAGAQYTLNSNFRQLEHITSFVQSIQCRLNAGYTCSDFFAAVNARYDYANSHLPVSTLHAINGDYALTFGYRFHSVKRKLLGVL
ncbi:DUF4421 family protein [Chitinophaga sp. Cy-1792]|uniref:DUF4421 family protein n=1 Tax=Chitinophaga sp. Cy-1792 TaxID=2608339 RepID=UPI0014231B2F|nr:DUF4421 family protein [Chitinophaga sp. Cy-1792]NIG56877.1 DUF4421 domain-containing protein [Chitinophaga sp. Cy-1792]